MSKAILTDPIDAVKAYWNARPCNLRHSSKEQGTKEYFEEVERKKFFVEPHLVSFADFRATQDKNVLEIGCGLGTTTINFAKAGAKKVTAIDLSEQSIKLAKQRAKLYHLEDRVDFHVANAEKLSTTLSNQKYDLIFSFGVIHHTPNPEKILQEAHQLLDAKGTLKLMVYYKYSWKVLWIFLKYGKLQFWKLPQLIAKYSEAQTGCPITFVYSKKEAKMLLEKAGFQLIKAEVDHIFPYQIKSYVQHKYVKTWYFRFLPKSLFRFLEKHFGWHLCLTAIKK